MKIKMKAAAILLTAAVAVSATGCGVVKVIPKGTEAEYTGISTFDAAAMAEEDWGQVVSEVTENAQDITAVLDTAEAGNAYAVKFTGTVEEHNTDTPKGYLAVSVDGVEDPVRVSTGSAVSGTAIRGCQSIRGFMDFENQTQWSQYARALNAQAMENVIDAQGIGDDTVGETIEVVGCYTPSADGTVTVVPVSLTVE